MADALASGASVLRDVGVQVPLRPQVKWAGKPNDRRPETRWVSGLSAWLSQYQAHVPAVPISRSVFYDSGNEGEEMPDPSTGDEDAERRETPTSRGAVRWQEPGVTTPRPPTVAESRARDKARRTREAERRLVEVQAQKAEERRRTRNKVLMGSVVVAGIAAVVAVGYAVIDRDDDVEATCVQDGSNVVAPEEYCERGTASSSGGGGVFIYAGSPYRYYYGGRNQGIGTIASGGNVELPRGTRAKTSSGSTITKSDGSGSVSRSPSVSRGGFGSSSSGSSGS